ncbi:MAG: hypothetical protein H6740_27635 [Alphaproteobacteria bacterium]|nr:hypothetical protein [Alphaproteobacteria bacterium]
MLLLLLACTPKTESPPGDDSAAQVDSAPGDSVVGQDWLDPILRLDAVAVDNTGMELTDAVVAGDRLALLGQQQQAQGGVWLFDRSDPEAPVFLDRTTLWHVQSGCYDGELLWGVDRMSTLWSFDISGDKPEIRNSYPIGGADGAVDCAPGRLAWGRGTRGAGVARIEAGAIVEQWGLSEAAVGVALDGETLWTASTGWLRAWSLAEGAPRLLSELALSGACRDIALAEGLLAVACGSEGAHLISRDPDEPELLGTWSGAWSARAVALTGDTLLVAGWSDLLAIDVSDPSAPRFIGAEAANSSVMGLAAGEDGLVYVADWRTPFLARVQGGAAPDIRLSPAVPYPGELVAVYNDGPEPLTLSGVSAGELRDRRLEPGGASSWQLPEDLAPDTLVEIYSDDPDEPSAALRVASLGNLSVGSAAPEFYEFDLNGQLYSTEALRGEIVFLGLFSDG